MVTGQLQTKWTQPYKLRTRNGVSQYLEGIYHCSCSCIRLRKLGGPL
jgi:hypothetical protein